MPTRINITGQRFGRLVAVECVGPVGASIQWRLLCDCGNEKIALASNVRSGKTFSCGCAHREVAQRNVKSAKAASVEANLKHGHSASRNTALRQEYNVWLTMRQRCNNPRSQRYDDYGRRGIRVCERWDSFEHFIADMGPRPAGTSIERIDNDGNYEPSNCRWATPSEQAANQRCRKDAHWIEHNGERRTIAEWARITGIKPVTLYARINRYRWPIAKALAPNATEKSP